MARCDSYDFGECTYYACQLSPWLPEYLGNATDWLADAQAAGLQTGPDPMPAAIVVYAAGGGYSEFGHVAVVRQVYRRDSFLVSEMNFAAWDVVDTRVSSLFDVEGFIYPPGGYVPPGGGSADSGGGSSSVDDLRGAWGRLQDALGNQVPVNIGWLAAAADQLRDLRG